MGADTTGGWWVMLRGVVLRFAGVPRPGHSLEETVIVELDVAGYTTGVFGRCRLCIILCIAPRAAWSQDGIHHCDQHPHVPGCIAGMTLNCQEHFVMYLADVRPMLLMPLPLPGPDAEAVVPPELRNTYLGVVARLADIQVRFGFVSKGGVGYLRSCLS
jgi:hypothetical protein